MSLPVCYRMVCIIISVLDIAQLPYTSPIYYLVGGLEHLDYFPYIGNVIIPTDELICFFRGVGISPTSYYSLV